MSPPFGSLENPFAKPVERSKDTAKLIGIILGADQEAAFREALGSTSDDTNLDITPTIEDEPELSDRERLEITYNLTEQYEKETQSLRDRGLLETNVEGVEFIRGIDGFEYLLPSLETITNRLLEQKERLDIKAEQGFTKLILVPFATSLDRQIESLSQFLVNYKKKHENFKLNKEEQIYILREARRYKNSDVNGDLVYDVKVFNRDQEKRQGWSKKQILDEERSANSILAGWRVELFQEDCKISGIRKIPNDRLGQIDGSKHRRRETEADRCPNEYLANQLSGESGQTPEDWISAFLYQLQETGKLLDDQFNGEGHIAFLIGAWFQTSGEVPCVSWDTAMCKVLFDSFFPTFWAPNFGARFVVRV